MGKTGKSWKFGDNISTDLIAPGRLFHLRSNLPELAKHVLEDADPDFASNMSEGDFVSHDHQTCRSIGGAGEILRTDIFPQLHQCRASGDRMRHGSDRRRRRARTESRRGHDQRPHQRRNAHIPASTRCDADDSR